MELKRILSTTDDIAFSANGKEITYSELHSILPEYCLKLAETGITSEDRVLILGHSDYMFDTFMWFVAALYLGASPINASDHQSQMEIDLRIKSSKVKATVDYNGNIKIVNNKSFKQHPQETFFLFTSNTTIKQDGLLSTEPFFINLPNDYTQGFPHSDTFDIFFSKLGKVKISQLCCLTWEIAYTPHNFAACLYTGGGFHWVKTEKELFAAQEKYKTNSISTYPISAERICAAGKFTTNIPLVEFSGGSVSPELVEKTRDCFNPDYIVNSFGSSRSGICLYKILSRDDDAKTVADFVHMDLSKSKLKVDNDGLLWIQRKNGPWVTDGDLFTVKDGIYKFVGRIHDEHFNFGGGKVSTFEIEGYVNAFLKPIKGCGDHCYIFPMNGLEGRSRHGLIYSGEYSATKLKIKLDELISYKRPQAIYRVEDRFWTQDIKVSRSRISDKIKNNKDCIIEKCLR